ncbi:MAG: class I SAM-dependent methyltransferase [Dehalococcoidia bacterium]
MAQIDPQAIKDTARTQWGRAAEGWRKHDDRFRQVTAPVTDRLLELANVGPAKRVLDIACGTGEPALPAARIVGPQGFVLATDIAPEMLEVAREKAAAEGVANVEFRLVDGEELDVEAESFDAVTCRCGIMFMPAPLKCLRQAWAALRPGGRVAVAVWGSAERSPFHTVPRDALRPFLDSPPPDPTLPGGVLSFSDERKLTSTLSEAGFVDVRVEGLELLMSEFESGEEYWRFQGEMSGPLKDQVSKLSPEARQAAALAIATAAGGGDPKGKVRLNGYMLLASGTK